MRVTIVNSSDLAAAGRMDAGFHILLAEHRDLVRELMEKFTVPELAQLVRDLPYDQAAARGCIPRVATPATQAEVAAWAERADRPTGGQFGARKCKKIEVCAYVAAAAQFMRNRVREDVLDLRRQELERLEFLAGVLAAIKDKGADHLRAAILRDAPPEKGKKS